MKQEDLAQLSGQLSQVSSELSTISLALGRLSQCSEIPRENQPAQPISCQTPMLLTPTPITLPQLPPQQSEYALEMFKLVAELGANNLPAAFQQRLGTWHAIFAATKDCEAWSKEWDKVIDQALGLVQQGAERVRTFVRDSLTSVGFPGWAVEILGGVADIIVDEGESPLKKRLELARRAGKLGLWARCKWPW